MVPEGDVWASTVDHVDARLVNVSLDYLYGFVVLLFWASIIWIVVLQDLIQAVCH